MSKAAPKLDIEQIILNKNKKLKKEYKGSLSVSKLCNEFLKNPFDQEAQAHQCYLKGLNDPNYKYHGMTEKQILEAWETKSRISKHYGSLLDDFAGMYLTEKDEQTISEWKDIYNFETDLRLKNNCLGLIQFYTDITSKTNYRFVARELPVYTSTDKGKINGRFDCLLYDPDTDSYIIIDWKTTDKIATRSFFNKYLRGPADYLDECEMNLYTIQLHVYKKSLADTYGLAPYSRISVYVCNLLKEPVNGKYYKLFPQNFEFDIDRINKFIDYGNFEFKRTKEEKLAS